MGGRSRRFDAGSQEWSDRVWKSMGGWKETGGEKEVQINIGPGIDPDLGSQGCQMAICTKVTVGLIGSPRGSESSRPARTTVCLPLKPDLPFFAFAQ